MTDFASNQLVAYGVYSGGVLNFLLNGPFRTGSEPTSVAIDPRGKFMYVSNALDSSVTAYVIDLPTGTPSTAVNPTGSATNSTDTQPDAITVDPALGRFVYTANILGNSISGFRLDPTAGTLTQTQSTPYPSGSKPTALVAYLMATTQFKPLHRRFSNEVRWKSPAIRLGFFVACYLIEALARFGASRQS